MHPLGGAFPRIQRAPVGGGKLERWKAAFLEGCSNRHFAFHELSVENYP
jgi:hypothetical protein